MTTRLDRLFVLLDTGSTPLIRKSAAEQLGDVQRLHSYDLDVLLEKVHNYLCSTNWDTRVAAGYALASIAKNVPTLSSHCAQNTVQDDISSVHLASVYMFSKFNIQHVLNCGSFLLGCEGSQYDINMKNSGFDDNERMSSQRTLLNKHLGLDFANGMGIDSPEFFKDEDLKLNFHQRTPLSSPTQSQYPADTVEQQMLSVKSACQQSDYSTVGEGVLSDTFSPSKRLKLNHDDEEKQKLVIDIEKSSQHTDQLVKSWPFQYFCDVLMNELFHASWEVRHGAATGLREIIKQHGMHAGKTKSITGCLSISANQTWLSDAAIRLLCVLALDRFGDFVSDEVVAPVRETCSQTIGVIAGRLTAPGVQRMLDVVLQLCSQHQWEVRHGGMLSLKYILAVRQDLTGALLPMLMPVVLRGLQDSDDDVRAVSAATLIPVADKVFSILSEQVPMMLSCLWNVLLDLDDLTASTNSIMTLLSLLLSPTSATAIDSEVGCLTDLVPRLWPFLRHSLVTARRSAFQTLLALLSSTSSCQERCWVIPILQDTLRHVYQRSLLETQPEVLDLIERVWSALLQSVPAAYLVGTATPWLGVWLCLLMQPATISYDSGYLIEARHRVKECYSGKQNLGSEGRRMIAADVEQRDYIGGGVCSSDADDVDIIMRARLTGARLLGILASYLTQSDIELPAEMTETPIVSLSKLFLFHLNTKSAMQRLVVAQVIFYWARQPKPCLCQESVKMRMIECLGETVYFDEIAIAFTRMQTDVRDFLACLKQEDVNLDAVFSPNAIVSLDQAMHLVLDVYDEVKIRLRPRVTSSFEERRKQLHYVVSTTNNDQQTLSIRVLASLAMAVVQLNLLPEKLNPIIRPIMDAIKKEENLELRHQAAESLSAVMKQCLVHSPNPNSKIIKNLVMYLCCDASVTPSVSYPVPQKPTDVFSLEIPCDMECGIITLANLQKASDLARKRVHRSPTVSEAGKLPGCSALPSSKAVLSLPDQSQLIDENEARQQHIIQRLGSEAALLSICRQFGEAMPQHLPDLWQLCNLPLLKCQPNSEKVTEDDQQLVNALQLLETISSNLHIDLLNQMLDRLSHLSSLLNHKHTSVRHMACRVVVAFAIQKMVPVMSFFIEHVVPGLENLLDVRLRQGVCETLTNLVDQLGVRLCPFLVLIMMPVLGRMVDPDPSVRMVASHCFAALVSLMPLESGFADPPDMLPALTARRKQERDFIDQLLDPSKLQPFSVDVQIHANLRKYQLDGVSWLTFLNKYRLHGILCDDMGLGKTLQCLCLLASHHYHQRINSPDDKPLPSLVVCPSTLLGHWVYETKKFVDVQYLSPLMYSGLPVERSRLQRQVKSHNLIIASYEVVRNDIDFFSAQRWSYCILDEGHVIRNGKTKLSKATKQLICQHRLILSGTPIQNNVHDLWSLFDFLMPGFLGTEKQFYTSYGKPIFMSREAKSSSKEQEAGVLAMERLHRQVLPFILRRLKEDVLSDLPQKIIQDYYCDLSPLQVELYEDFAQSSVRSDVEESVSCFIGSGKDGVKATSRSTSSIFQALHYLRKVCNHPALVLTPSHPKHSEIVNRLTQQRISLHHLNHSPKLIALRQLLLDCGIGIDDWHASSACSANTDLPLDSGRPVVGQHRVLVFCQLRGMLDIVEKDLLRVHMPSVTYLRLDGSVPPADRHSVVHRFNNDPSIDVLLLTTHIGGLGLNLTGADTVIFMEHDWNPMKDLQAMDRAHRIGQKKVVNVYRLISRGTLEEKIMSLQKFKMAIANTVIGEENSSMKSMGTDQLFDLFALDHSNINAKIAAGSDDGLSKVSSRVSTMMESLEELWDEKQYTDEYDIDNFIASLSASSHT